MTYAVQHRTTPSLHHGTEAAQDIAAVVAAKATASQVQLHVNSSSKPFTAGLAAAVMVTIIPVAM